MKLYVKQKPLSLTGKFTVINSKEEERYYVESAIVSFGRKLRILDIDKNEVASVKEKFSSVHPHFKVYHGGSVVFEVMKKFTLAKHKYVLEGSAWTVKGDLPTRDYTISSSFGKIVTVQEVIFAGVDCLELDVSNIVNEANVIRALAAVLAIDCVVSKKRTKQQKKLMKGITKK
jgi:uncharacterized protein YxjI